MPASLTIAVGALCVPFVLFSVAVWGAYRAGTVSILHLYMLIIGISFNVLSVAMMSVYTGGLVRDLRTLLALVSVLGMLMVAAVGTQAYMRTDVGAKQAVARWGVIPWVFWMLVFIWAMFEQVSAWFA